MDLSQQELLFYDTNTFKCTILRTNHSNLLYYTFALHYPSNMAYSYPCITALVLGRVTKENPGDMNLVCGSLNHPFATFAQVKWDHFPR